MTPFLSMTKVERTRHSRPHALGFLLLDHAVLAAHLALGVGEQRDGDAVAVAEVGVRQAIVARHAEHHAVVLDELVLVVGEVGGDHGAAGRAVLRIEIQHDVLLALEGRQVHRPACRHRAARTTAQVVPVAASCDDSIPKLFYFDNAAAQEPSVVASLHIIAAVRSQSARRLDAARIFCGVIGRSARFSCAARCRASPACSISARSLALARRDDVESRIVERAAGAGTRRTARSRASRREKRDWTLLVSGVNLHHAAADDLLRRFAFVPQARLDDVMVSYATPGGGVGPHVDSYDVFLLQGAGRRRWTVVGEGRRRSTRSRGDLLYLPPGVAPRRRGARALLHLLDRLSRAARRRARRRIPRLAARARAAGRALPRPAPAPGATRRRASPRTWSASPQRVLERIRWTRARRRDASSANI